MTATTFSHRPPATAQTSLQHKPIQDGISLEISLQLKIQPKLQHQNLLQIVRRKLDQKLARQNSNANLESFFWEHSSPSTPTQATSTPFWFGTEDREHIKIIFDKYTKFLNLNADRAPNSREPLLFIGRIGRFPLNAQEPTKPSTPPSSSYSSNKNSTKKGACASSFTTYDLVYVYKHDLLTPGSYFPLSKKFCLKTTWAHADGVPLSFERANSCYYEPTSYLYCRPEVFECSLQKPRFHYFRSDQLELVGHANHFMQATANSMYCSKEHDVEEVEVQAPRGFARCSDCTLDGMSEVQANDISHLQASQEEEDDEELEESIDDDDDEDDEESPSSRVADYLSSLLACPGNTVTNFFEEMDQVSDSESSDEEDEEEEEDNTEDNSDEEEDEDEDEEEDASGIKNSNPSPKLTVHISQAITSCASEAKGKKQHTSPFCIYNSISLHFK